MTAHVPRWRASLIATCGVWSTQDVAGAEQWLDTIGRALERCTWFAVLLTPRSVKAKWVRQEVQYALQAPRYERRVLPLLLATCKIERLAWPLLNLESFFSNQALLRNDSRCRSLVNLRSTSA